MVKVNVVMNLDEDLHIKPDDALDKVKYFVDLELDNVEFLPYESRALDTQDTHLNITLDVDIIVDDIRRTIKNELVKEFKQRQNFAHNIVVESI